MTTDGTVEERFLSKFSKTKTRTKLVNQICHTIHKKPGPRLIKYVIQHTRNQNQGWSIKYVIQHTKPGPRLVNQIYHTTHKTRTKANQICHTTHKTRMKASQSNMSHNTQNQDQGWSIKYVTQHTKQGPRLVNQIFHTTHKKQGLSLVNQINIFLANQNNWIIKWQKTTMGSSFFTLKCETKNISKLTHLFSNHQ